MKLFKRAPKAEHAKPSSSKQRRGLRITGWVLISAGVVLLGAFAFENYVQNWIQSPDQTNSAKKLDNQWGGQVTATPTPILDYSKVPHIKEKVLPKAQEFATIRIPRFGADYNRPIGEGTDVEKVLNTVGIGHYLNTQWPGQRGNFALASHRTTHGAAFENIDKLKKGDLIYIDTKDGTYTYTVNAQRIVWPTEVWVIAKTPNRNTAKAKVAHDYWLTLTTCTPKHTAEKRLIVWAKLTGFAPRA